MAVQFSPLVALIIGGAVTVAGGALIYNKYNTSKNVDPVPVVALQSKSPVKIKQETPVDKPEIAKLLLPEFGLLRVEEDGSVLVSGTTAPNSVVEIIQNETIFGKTKSASNGDFVVVFETPLKPGNYELYIRSTPKDGKTTLSAEAGIVVIPEEGGEMLAMVSKPDGPSKLIQVTKLEPKAEQRAMEVPISEEKVKQQIVEKVAKVEQTKTTTPPVENNVVEQKVAEPKSVEIVESKVDPVKEVEAKVENEVVVDKISEVAKVEKETPPAVIVKKTEAPKSVEMAKLETKSVEEVKVTPVDVVKETPVEVVKKTPVEAVKETPVKEEKIALLKITPVEEAKQDEVATVVPQLRPEKNSEVEVQPKAEIVKKTPPPVITKPVFLEAVEVENEKIFIAGTGHPKHIVNVYIDDKFIGNAKVNNQGIFLVESNSTLTVGNHTVRADMLGSANSTVVARAQVPLIHDLPETPKVVVEAPKEIVEAPKVAVVEVETPQAVEKTPIVVAETPKAVVETPKVVIEEPKVVLEMPKAVVEEPKVVVEAPKVVAEAPKVVVEESKVVVETPKVVVEESKVVVETPKVVVETPKNIVVAKVQEAEIKKSEKPAIEPANKKQAEQLPENKVVAGGEMAQSAAALAVSKKLDQTTQEVAKLDSSTGSKISSAKPVVVVEEVIKPDTLPVDAKQLEVAKLEEKATKKITRKLVKNDSEPVIEEVTPAKKNVVTKQKVAIKQDVIVKQEEVVAVKPAPVVEKTSKPVQIAKNETKTPPVAKKEPKRVIRTSSSVIIRRGDNLWRISRRILGRGIRYSTIYQANRDQIKNPALIFPGQIFKVPEKMVDVDGNTKS